ncbi:3-hydroxy-3-methylglutaryl-coenzyme A reductase [Alteracholeplasma palmae J233]|uniref:3-hydroxy-3-methylglutaryl coenzyme A reductase n=1 Tax=Alteracholeplasma palmae (strain ATCC 49389 / J233) TaxID=1318466 RepID=U4KQL3_ALTPJ|nr:hydroxymethylglutaryl-CoA reductase, degradative [Alteracholeplasma palmae]CCV64780.1 3-hydroxy-3-methylglutaryl-coenzyme A reductase [Alteracholeplasma palmae J233]
MKNNFDKFYFKTKEERIDILKSLNLYDTSLDVSLNEHTASHMIENYLTNFEIPMGLAPNFLINGKEYVIPMVTEEASVVAAASKAAKIIKENGGFNSFVISRLMTGEIIFHQVKNAKQLMSLIKSVENTLFKVAQKAHPKIKEIGGGLVSLHTKQIEDFVILYVIVNTKDAMGANTINTILEALSSYLETITKEKILMSILSNHSTECLVESYCEINPKTLKFPEEIGMKLTDASRIAHLDIYRAATHNKGVLNGIDAVVLSTGNDTRAISAAIHSYAASNGSYQSLTKWSVNANGFIVGSIRIPMPIGTVGGAINVYPLAALSKKILNYKTSEELMMIIASVGLAQNFAAIYALTTDGIQKGHMSLHARSIAIQTDATSTELPELIKELKISKDFSLDNAKNILNIIRKKDN